MPNLLQAIDEAAAERWNRLLHLPQLKQYLLTGDDKHLAKVPTGQSNDVTLGRLAFGSFVRALGLPTALGEPERRFLEVCLKKGYEGFFGRWLDWLVTAETGADAVFEAGCQALVKAGATVELLAAQTARLVTLATPAGQPNAAGRFLLGLSRQTLADTLAAVNPRDVTRLRTLAGLLAGHAPRLLAQALGVMLTQGKANLLVAAFWVGLLEKRPQDFEELAARALPHCQHPDDRFDLAKGLLAVNPAKYHGALREAAKVALSSDQADRDEISQWLLANLGAECLSEIAAYLAARGPEVDCAREYESEKRTKVLSTAVEKLGREALPLLRAGCECDLPLVRCHALSLWTGFKDAADNDELRRRFAAALAAEDPAGVARSVRLAADWHPGVLETELWGLLAHKSRPVREAAAQAVAKLGDARLPKAKELWSARRADTRLAAVSWLQALGTPAAIAELQVRLDAEEDEDTRDAILLALEKLAGGAEQADSAELKRRIKQTVAKLTGPPVRWLDPKKLPAPRLKDGSKLPADSLLYVLYRQSRVKEMRADLEAKPVYAQLDRQTSGDLGLALLLAFLGSDMKADDRWVLASAALVGDDRLVPLLTKQIASWAESARGKLAEYAVQALALLGTDAALLAVDALAIRYRAKFKNIGKAASEAFAAAAQARGVTTEELGDVVAPWLGFTPNQPRFVEAGKAKIEVSIGADFKLAFRDAATGRKVAALPGSAPANVKAELKTLSASLKEAVKGQLLRMESLMVRQFRWPLGRWRELYLQHPLLLPFAQRLVWGHYDPAGQLARTFRALEDRSLTDAADAAVALPATGTAGIVHPLELSAESRQAWLTHLADYEVASPFPQLERPVVTVKPEERALKRSRGYADVELNAMTFKGRAERLGWHRGSVCDAGGISYYLKSFPAAGVDVFLGLDGMYVGIDMYSDITLEEVFFVKSGSVKIGSYEYDEPREAEDPRLVAFGDVPPIAFSEAMGDLQKIAGNRPPPGEEQAG